MNAKFYRYRAIRGVFVQGSERKHQLPLGQAYNLENHKFERVMLIGMESVGHKFVLKRKIESEKFSMKIIVCLREMPLLKQRGSMQQSVIFCIEIGTFSVHTKYASTNL